MGSTPFTENRARLKSVELAILSLSYTSNSSGYFRATIECGDEDKAVF